MKRFVIAAIVMAVFFLSVYTQAVNKLIAAK